MANCGIIEFAKGVLIYASKIVNSTFIDGEIVSSTLKDSHFTGNISFDEDTAEKLPVNKEAVAAVFNSCGGLPLIPGTMVPTCEEMNMAIRLAVCEGCDGGGIGEGGDTITAVTWNADYTKLTIATAFPDGSTKNWEVDFAEFISNIEAGGDTITGIDWDTSKTALTIHTSLPGGGTKDWGIDFTQFVSAGGGDTITGTSWSADNTTLTIHTLLPDGVTIKDWDVDFSGIGISFELSPLGPDQSQAPEIPTLMYGKNREAILGDPEVWIKIKIGDEVYLVPGFLERIPD